MPHSHDHSGHAGYNKNSSNRGSWLTSRTGIGVIAAVAVLGVLIATGYGQQLLGYWPLLLIGVCVLSHFFMHGSHGGHGGHRHAEEEAPRKPEAQQAANAPQAAGTQPGQPEKKHKHGGC
jgi:hypothetical protein